MTSDFDDTYEPHHASSPTDHLLSELQLYGFRPFQDEPDPRPLPEGNIVAGAIADIFDALIVSMGDTRLEPDPTTSCGRPSISSTAPPAGSSANWTTTSRHSVAVSGNRTAAR